MSKRDFLSLLDFSKNELHYLIERAKQFRVMHETETCINLWLAAPRRLSCN